MLRAIVRQDMAGPPQSEGSGEQGAILAVTKAELAVLLRPQPAGLGCNLLSSWLAACRIRTGVERCVKSRPHDSKIMASAGTSYNQSGLVVAELSCNWLTLKCSAAGSAHSTSKHLA